MPDSSLSDCPTGTAFLQWYGSGMEVRVTEADLTHTYKLPYQKHQYISPVELAKTWRGEMTTTNKCHRDNGIHCVDTSTVYAIRYL